MRAARYHGVLDVRIEEPLLQEVNVMGSLIYSSQDYDDVIANMVAGRYQTDGWVHHIPLDNLLDGFDDLRAGRKMKILVDL